MQLKGNIASAPADAVVNAANNELAGGSGVDGAIHAAARWDALDDACQAIGYCDTGKAVVTPAFDMEDVKYIIHTVAPNCCGNTRYTGEPEDEEKMLLYECYYNSILLADVFKCRSVNVPSLGTGAFGFPMEHAPGIFLQAVQDYEERNKNIEVISMVCFTSETEKIYRDDLKDELWDSAEEFC